MSTGPWQEESSGQRAAVLSRTRGLGCLRKRKLKALTLSPAYVTYYSSIHSVLTLISVRLQSPIVDIQHKYPCIQLVYTTS